MGNGGGWNGGSWRGWGFRFLLTYLEIDQAGGGRVWGFGDFGGFRQGFYFDIEL